MLEHKVVLIDSQQRARGADELIKSVAGTGWTPWSFTGVETMLDAMTALGWEHYQSLEIASRDVCSNFSGHGVLLFFRRQRPPIPVPVTEVAA